MSSVRNSALALALLAGALGGCATTGDDAATAAAEAEAAARARAQAEAEAEAAASMERQSAEAERARAEAMARKRAESQQSRARTGAVRGAGSGDGYQAVVFGGNAAALARIAKGTEFARGTGICLAQGEELSVLTARGLVALAGGDCRKFGEVSRPGGTAGAGMAFRVVTRGSGGALAYYPVGKQLPLDEVICLKRGDQLTVTDTRGRAATFGAGCNQRVQAGESENTGGTTNGALDPAVTGRRALPVLGL